MKKLVALIAVACALVIAGCDWGAFLSCSRDEKVGCCGVRSSCEPSSDSESVATEDKQKEDAQKSVTTERIEQVSFEDEQVESGLNAKQ